MALSFVIGVFIFAPETLPEYKHRVLAIVAAITTGLFAYFLTGEIGLDVQFGESRFGKTSVKATGGIAVFVFVLIWWFSPWAPVKREALEEVKKGTEEIKKDTGEIKSDISDIKNTTTQLLEEFRRAQPVRIFQGRAEGIVEKPSPRAHELAAKIPDDADPYSLALKAIAQGRNDDANRRLDEARKTKEIELSKIYEAKGLAEKFAGRFPSSIDWFEKALALSENNPQVLHELGMSFSSLRKYREAERHLRQALEVQKQAHTHRGGVASILHDLGLVCYLQEKYAEAESFYKRAQEAQSREYADLSPLLKLGYNTMSIRGLGQVYSMQHKYSEAEVHFLQALSNFDDCVNFFASGKATWTPPAMKDRTAPGRLVPSFCSALFFVGWNLNDLADIYFLQARYSEALPHVERALKIQEQELWPDHLDIAGTLTRMGLLHLLKADYGKAERLLRRANGHINAVVPVFLLKPPQRLEIFYLLGSIYTVWGQQNPKAERLFCRALVGYKSLRPPDHRAVAMSYNGLARLRLIQGKFAEADILANQALEAIKQAIGEKGLGLERGGMTDSLNILGELSLRQGRLIEAESLFQQALGIAEKTLGSGHPLRAVILNNRALVYFQQERFREAERDLRKALKISEKTFGLDHPQVASWLDNLATLYHRQGRHTEATSLEARAKRIWTMYPMVTRPRLPSKPDMRVDLVGKSPCHNKGGTG